MCCGWLLLQQFIFTDENIIFQHVWLVTVVYEKQCLVGAPIVFQMSVSY